MPRWSFRLAAMAVIAAVLARFSPVIAQTNVSQPNILASDSVYTTINVFTALTYFVQLNEKLDGYKYPSSVVTDQSIYGSFGYLAGSVNHEHIRAPSPRQTEIRTSSNYYYYSGYARYDQSRQLTVGALQDRAERMMCSYFATTFITSVMDLYGDLWLFSDEFDDNLGGLVETMTRQVEMAHQTTRLACATDHKQLLSQFDRLYRSCVGDKLIAFRSLAK